MTPSFRPGDTVELIDRNVACANPGDLATVVEFRERSDGPILVVAFTSQPARPRYLYARRFKLAEGPW